MSKFPGDKGYQAFRILQLAFVVAPVLAGLDKFFYMLTNWSNYISPMAVHIIQGHDRFFMSAVGVVEVIVGIGVMLKPKVFAYIVSLWILCIFINLLMLGKYYDIALRDLGLFLGALALARLSHKYQP